MKFIQNSPQPLISAGFPAASGDLNAGRQVGSTNPGASDVTTPPAVEAYRRGEHTHMHSKVRWDSKRVAM